MSRRWIVSAVAVVAVGLSGLTAGSAQSRRPMGAVDLLNVPRLLDPQISPDGHDLLFTRAEADWKSGRSATHLWRTRMEGAASTEPVRLTRAASSESSGRWSPDGKTIAFVGRGSDTDVGQIFLLAAAGGEPKKLTEHATNVSNISWIPDGSGLLFTAADPRTAEERARERVRDDVYAYDETYKQIHLWKVTVATGAEAQLTKGDFSVGAYDVSDDGQKVVYQSGPTPLLDDAEKAELWVANLDGAGARRLTTNTVAETSPAISANGQVLFISDANANFETYYNGRLFVVPAGGGPARVLVGEKEPIDVDRAMWSKDGKSIYFIANLGVREELYVVPASGGAVRQLTNGPHSFILWSRSGDRLALTMHDTSNDGEVWVFDPSSTAPAPVTHVFDYLARDFALGKQEAITWRGADGVSVEGVLTYPVDYRQGQKCPLVVMVHGGPNQSDRYSLGSTNYAIQVFAGKGYAVLQPNYRGSTGYGDRFLRDMIGHYFHNSHLDVLAGVDELVRRGIADPDRLVITGWSAGAHMANKLITFTDRFKAASSGAGIAEWLTMYMQSDIRTPRTAWFGGTPWQKDAPIDTYWNGSPLKDVANVKTPTLFFVGDRDVRVGMSQSVTMFHALKGIGVPTRLYVAPREPHSWSELRHILFKMNAEIEWFERHAIKRPYTWETAPDS